MKLLDAPITAPRRLTIKEQKEYLMACPQPLRDVATLMIELGLRPSEALDLECADISLEENWLQIQKGKTKNFRRKLPLAKASRKVLQHRLKTAQSEKIFPKTSNVRLGQMHRQVLASLDIEQFTDDYFVLYAHRHGCASTHIKNQTDVVTLSEFLGHGDLKTLKRYSHPSFEHKTAAIKRVEKSKAKAV